MAYNSYNRVRRCLMPFGGPGTTGSPGFYHMTMATGMDQLTFPSKCRDF